MKTEQHQESEEKVWYEIYTDLKEDESEKVSSGENIVVTPTNAVTSIEEKMADDKHNLNQPSSSKDAVKAAEADEPACHSTATTNAVKIISQATAHPVQEWDKEKLKTEQDQEMSEEVWYETFTDLKEDDQEKVSSGENLVVTPTNIVTSIEGKMADVNRNLNKSCLLS